MNELTTVGAGAGIDPSGWCCFEAKTKSSKGKREREQAERSRLVSDEENSDASGHSDGSSIASSFYRREKYELDPMDEETYRLVLAIPEPKVVKRKSQMTLLINPLEPQTGKLIKQSLKEKASMSFSKAQSEWHMICHNEEVQYSQAEIKLRQDFASNKVRWYGIWRKDLWCFLRNTNPVVSVCYSHRLHTVSRMKRMIAYFIQMLFVLDIATALTEAQKCHDCQLRHPGTSDYNGCYLKNYEFSHAKTDILDQYPFITNNFCLTCDRLGMLFAFQTLGRRWGAAVYATVTNCLFTVLVFQMLMCNCMMHKEVRHREFGTLVGYFIVGLVTVGLLVLVPLLLFWISLKHMGLELFYNFVLGKIGSWAFVTLINIIAFSIFFRKQAPGRGKKGGAQFNVTAEQYLNFLDEYDGGLLESFDEPESSRESTKESTLESTLVESTLLNDA